MCIRDSLLTISCNAFLDEDDILEEVDELTPSSDFVEDHFEVTNQRLVGDEVASIKDSFNELMLSQAWVGLWNAILSNILSAGCFLKVDGHELLDELLEGKGNTASMEFSEDSVSLIALHAEHTDQEAFNLIKFKPAVIVGVELPEDFLELIKDHFAESFSGRQALILVTEGIMSWPAVWSHLSLIHI